MTIEIRGLTLHQPYASLIAVGAKTFETRRWRTQYRGLLAIHAAQKYPMDNQFLAITRPCWEALPVEDLPRGAIVAVARLQTIYTTDEVEIVVMGLTETDKAFGDYNPGRYAWKLEDVVALDKPIPCRGAQALWRLPADVEHEVREVIDV